MIQKIVNCWKNFYRKKKERKNFVVQNGGVRLPKSATIANADHISCSQDAVWAKDVNCYVQQNLMVKHILQS